ncbi:MAG: hypothetical protein ABJA78_02220 [Ferruginibacter sp.]
MKRIILMIASMNAIMLQAQNVGIGTITPAARLDVSGLNNWNLSATEGDMRVGNNAYRIKFGVALDGGGAGSSSIMQYGQPGGYNVLNLGAQGNNIIQLNGGSNRAGIGTDNPQGKLEISGNGSSSEPQLLLTQTNSADYSRLRMNSSGSRYWDVAAISGASTAADRMYFYNSGTGGVLTLTGDKKVGIDNSNPNAPLAFAPALGKKITLYPGATGDVGFGVGGNRLQIFSDNPNADVAIGYDAAGTFNERFAFKPNGALAVNGNLGSAGQLLSSNGSGAASWINVKPSFYSFKQNDYQLSMPANSNSPGESTGWYTMGGLHNQPIVLNQQSSVSIMLKLPVDNPSNTFGGNGTSAIYLGLYDPSNNYIEFDISYLYIGDGNLNDGIVFNTKVNLPPGTYHTHVKVRRFGGDDVATGSYYTGLDIGTLTVQIFPE